MTASLARRQNFADVIALLQPLTAKAFPPAAVARVMDMAALLPPIACGGFEFSLMHGDAPVDLMQCHVLDDRGARRLVDHIQRHCDLAVPAWQWLHTLVTTDRRGVASVWLEIDAGAARDAPPSIFLEFDAKAPVSPDRLYAWLDNMPLSDAAAKRAAIENILAALPGNAHVSHIGAMFSRADTPLRINIKKLPSRALAPFMARIGIDIPSGAATRLIEYAYRATICLDLTDTILPRLGVEYSFSTWPAREGGWRELAEMVSAGDLLPGQWDAFRGWARVLTPLDAPLDWPDHCLIDEVSHRDRVKSVIECGPSHVKATFSAHRPPSLKAYVGFRSSLMAQDGTILPGDTSHQAEQPRATALDDVLVRATDFLLRERTQDGLWRDFDFASLSSDEWVSGYIGAHLLATGTCAAHDAARAAWSVLRERRAVGAGWGYHRNAPPDADSTAWVLILADRLGLGGDPVVQANIEFLRRHLDDRGAAVTYSQVVLDGIGHPLPVSAAHEQWHDRHGEVTASAALAGLHAAVENLLSTQQPDGSWQAFWIESNAYSTGLACEAISRSALAAAGKPALRAAARWACGAIEREGVSPFDRAWLIRAALLGGDPRDDQRIANAAHCLGQEQRADGSWLGSCAMIVPVPDEQGLARTIEARDIHRNFTTATVLVALQRARAHGLDWCD